MPFQTPAGPAVLVSNIVTAIEASIRIGVHRVTFYEWARKYDTFPMPIAKALWDYEEVYTWFVQFVREHPEQYPEFAKQLLEETA